MKNQKGVTLISLTIYVIALTVIISMLSVISTYFYKNVNETQDDITPLTEFTNFNSYFTSDVNTSNIGYLKCGTEDYQYIALINKDTLKDENPKLIKYIYVSADKTVYRDDENTSIAVARNVDECSFVKQPDEQQMNSSKTKVKMTIKIGNTTKTYTYNINN